MGLAQLNLFGGAPAPSALAQSIPDRVTPAEYYVAMSSLQKFVRRGMTAPAVAAAAVMYAASPSNLKRRMSVILIEDIGLGDVPFVLKTISELSAQRMSFDDLAEIVVSMCGAVKSRDADDVFFLLKAFREGQLSTMSDAGFTGWQSEFSVLDRLSAPGEDQRWGDDVHPSYTLAKDIIEQILSIRGRAGDWLTTNMCRLVMVRWASEVSPRFVTNAAASDVRMFEDYVADVGIDGHTRYGKALLARAARRFDVSSENLHFYRFWTFGAGMNRRVVFCEDYAKMAIAWRLTLSNANDLRDASEWIDSQAESAYNAFCADRAAQAGRSEWMKR